MGTRKTPDYHCTWKAPSIIINQYTVNHHESLSPPKVSFFLKLPQSWQLSFSPICPSQTPRPRTEHCQDHREPCGSSFQAFEGHLVLDISWYFQAWKATRTTRILQRRQYATMHPAILRTCQTLQRIIKTCTVKTCFKNSVKTVSSKVMHAPNVAHLHLTSSTSQELLPWCCPKACAWSWTWAPGLGIEPPFGIYCGNVRYRYVDLLQMVFFDVPQAAKYGSVSFCALGESTLSILSVFSFELLYEQADVTVCCDCCDKPAKERTGTSFQVTLYLMFVIAVMTRLMATQRLGNKFGFRSNPQPKACPQPISFIIKMIWFHDSSCLISCPIWSQVWTVSVRLI